MNPNPTSEKPAPTPDRGSGDRRSPATLIVALVVIALVVITAVIVAVTRHHSSPSATGPVTTSAAPGANPGATGFGVPETDDFGRRVDNPNNPAGQPLAQTVPARKPSDTDWLTAAPAGVRNSLGGWQRVHGAVVPYSTSDGPTGVDADGLATGWAHTPAGCALAANWISFEVNARPGIKIIRERLVVSSAADLAQFDKDKAAGKLPDQMPANVTRWMLAPDAYKIVNYAPDLCVMQMASRTAADAVGNPQWLSTQASMAWVDGGWRLLPAPGANHMPPTGKVADLAGWTRWS